MAGFLRDALVDRPMRDGWRWTLFARLVGAVLFGAVMLLVTDWSVALVAGTLAYSMAVVYVAGGVWQWVARRRQRKAAVSDG